MSFSEHFLWGGDISATQIEGAWNEGGKSPVETDYMVQGDKKTMRYAYYQLPDGTIETSRLFSGLPKGAKYIHKEGVVYPNHTASDFYHRYKEDIALLGEMGFKALNLTISWARIFPWGVDKGVNPEGVEFYHNVLTECKKFGIKPIVTLYKYDMPAFYVEDWGGWSNRALIDEFVTFAALCMREYKDLVKHWITFNEINILRLIIEMHSKENPAVMQRIIEEERNQLVASARVVKLGHEISPDNQIGCMCAGVFGYPLTSDPADFMALQKKAQDVFYLCSDVFVRGYYPSYTKRAFAERGLTLELTEQDKVDLLAGKVDFMAFSYYASSCETTHPELVDGTAGGNFMGSASNPYLKASQWGWPIDPLGLKRALHELYDRYQIPLLLVENGLGAEDTLEEDKSVHDPYRIDYMSQHIAKMKEAVDEGVDLIGYTMWSCIDLISASSGELRKRYGFIYVDADEAGGGTFNRYRKDSFFWYKKVIASNGEDLG